MRCCVDCAVLAVCAGTFGYWFSEGANEVAVSLLLTVESSLVTDVACNMSAATCTHTLPNGLTPFELAQQYRAAGVQAVLFGGGQGSSFVSVMTAVFQAMRTLDYTPGNMMFCGGVEDGLSASMLGGADTLDFEFHTGPWDAGLKGPSYLAQTTDINFELYPSEGSRYMPQVWMDALAAQQNPYLSGVSSFAILGYTTLNIVQKMVELSLSDSIDDLLRQAPSLAAASPYGLLQFDRYGRFSTVEQVLYQLGRAQDVAPGATLTSIIVFPVNIAQPPVYPVTHTHIAGMGTRGAQC